jgi:hypothetical protein
MKNGKIVRIHVNQHEIRANGKLLNQEGCAPATLAPVLRVKTSKDNYACDVASIVHTSIDADLANELRDALVEVRLALAPGGDGYWGLNEVALKKAESALQRAYDKRRGESVARVIYQPFKPLSCGAKCWIETNTGPRTRVVAARRFGGGLKDRW